MGSFELDDRQWPVNPCLRLTIEDRRFGGQWFVRKLFCAMLIPSIGFDSRVCKRRHNGRISLIGMHQAGRLKMRSCNPGALGL